ncbi:MAG: efflux RND transporter periplasmic adaptor subunit [bacterium]
MKDILKMKGPMMFIGGSVVVAITAVIFAFFYKSSPKLSEAISVKKEDLTEVVSTTGKVTASENLDLGFSRGGRIGAVYAKVGDSVKKGQIIASLDSADLNASLLQAQAQLDKENINLNQIQNAGTGNSFDQRTTLQTTVNSNRTSMISNLKDSFIKVDGALGSNIDQFFNNSRTYPHFGNNVTSQGGATYSIQAITANQSIDLDNKARDLYVSLSLWNAANQNLTNSSSDADIERVADLAEKSITSADSLVSEIYTIVNSYQAISYQDQGVYSSLKLALTSAQNAISTSLSGFHIARSTYESSLSSVGPVATSIQQATVQSANAQVMAIQAQIENGIIRAPLDAQITKQDAKVGEVAVPSVPLVSLISVGNFQIDTYVSEADVAKIKAGNTASVVLDSYGNSNPFEAFVVSVDPAETITNGVGSYKVVLQFSNQSDLIKSGMTANIDISTQNKIGVLAVPMRIIVKQNNGAFVLANDEKGNTIQKKVTLGITGSNGDVEILSGLNEGDKVFSFSK